MDVASSLFCTLVNDEPDHNVYVQILVHSSPWLGTEEAFRGQAPTQPDPAPPKLHWLPGEQKESGKRWSWAEAET